MSLAMNLGMARATLTDLPEPAREVIVQAHEEAKQALKELRDFVRGLHPAVLNDQGLDAALSGLATRSPSPGATSPRPRGSRSACPAPRSRWSAAATIQAATVQATTVQAARTAGPTTP
ncbi:histidine kinase dimerization/phosphoacceptor domain-containing protein [Streptosporangium sp. NBC_01810]|uniref:histidine kinase dimerization/phosphoacceptor domain-containing protein n=1 Tax=Streptosporangium sp. NBC_01810 TaxID=2975951 RepID=UPI002DD810CF|nr:histidine kinase dimerization/phosphoacceptor domain-containing protein [Streptosporangium sp. NBC_01810]WSA25035.1 histidine kinase dimerization/phosphoacceptor domain-containing protein [Streptosporangium sp. NBC_01810]